MGAVAAGQLSGSTAGVRPDSSSEDRRARPPLPPVPGQPPCPSAGILTRLGKVSPGGESSSPGPARSPRIAGEVEKRDHRIIGWKRPLRSSSPTINPTPPCLLNWVLKCHVYRFFEPFQGWGLHHCPGQPVNEMLVETLKEKQGDLVLMCFRWSAWHPPLPGTLDVPLAWGLAGPGWGGRGMWVLALGASASRFRVWTLDSCLRCT